MYSIQKQTKILFIFSLLLSMGTYLTSSTFFGFQFLLSFISIWKNGIFPSGGGGRTLNASVKWKRTSETEIKSIIKIFKRTK